MRFIVEIERVQPDGERLPIVRSLVEADTVLRAVVLAHPVETILLRMGQQLVITVREVEATQ